VALPPLHTPSPQRPRHLCPLCPTHFLVPSGAYGCAKLGNRPRYTRPWLSVCPSLCLSVCLSVCLSRSSTMSTNRPTLMRFSSNGSPHCSFWRCKDVARIRIVYRNPHAGIGKARENDTLAASNLRAAHCSLLQQLVSQCHGKTLWNYAKWCII